MGTGWRRAFCTSITRDRETAVSESPSSSPSPVSCTKLGFFSGGGGSNPATPRLPSQTSIVDESPKLKCKTPKITSKSPRTLLGSNPSSPRSPLKLSLFKNSFKFRSSCGICLNSVKTGQGTAIYTAECSHAFHFPCIVAHVRNQGSLVCPVCSATWKDVPLLSIRDEKKHDVVETNLKPQVEEKFVVVSSSPSPRGVRTVSTTKQGYARSYDDDEPLLSPTAAGKFVPIPEADEHGEDEKEDDVVEFQGFFVNPNPSFSDEIPCKGRDYRNVEVKLLPESAVVSVGQTQETYAMVLRVKAPPPPPPPVRSSNAVPLLDPLHRAPIDLVTVLDVSGSMTGAKLKMLKRAMRLVVSSLSSADRLSIVAFSASPKRLLPLKRMTAHGQLAARHIIERLTCGQGTSVGDALRKATKVLEDRKEKNPVASIILLSDGKDEQVPSTNSNPRPATSHVSSTRFAHIEIPVHSFGFGKNGGYSHEPDEDAFAKCLGGLLSVVVQDLRIQLCFASGSAPAEISAVYSCNGRPIVLSSSLIRLGDLYAEEERELLLELRVPTSAVGAHHVISVKCSYKDPATQEVYYARDQALLVPRPQAVGSSAPKIQRLRNMFITTRAVAESFRLVEHKDFVSAHHLLASARALIMQSSCVSAEEYIKILEGELAELHWRREQQMITIQRRRGMDRMVMTDENGEPLTPTSAWRAAEKLAKVAIMKKSLSRVSDLHGFENARF